MDFKPTKTDKKITEIMTKLYLRHYSFADIFDYINGKDILEIFYKRLDKHIQIIPKNITNTYNITKEEMIRIIKNKDKKGTAILKFKIKDIIERYDRKQEFSKNKIKVINDLENDIKELEELLVNNKRKVNFLEEEKNNCMLYQILKNEDYEKLKTIKLDI